MTTTLVIGTIFLLAAFGFWHERHNSDSFVLSVTYSAGLSALGTFVLVVGLCRP